MHSGGPQWFCKILCPLRSITAHRDHFVRRLSVCPSVCARVRLSGSHTFLVVTHSYVSQATRAFLGMLPLCSSYTLDGNDSSHNFCSWSKGDHISNIKVTVNSAKIGVGHNFSLVNWNDTSQLLSTNPRVCYYLKQRYLHLQGQGHNNKATNCVGHNFSLVDWNDTS